MRFRFFCLAERKLNDLFIIKKNRYGAVIALALEMMSEYRVCTAAAIILTTVEVISGANGSQKR